jgi:hypothetical protein
LVAGAVALAGGVTNAWLPGSDAAMASAAGSWGNAIEVPGLAALNVEGNANVNSVSCTSAGNCAVGGYYKDGLGHLQAFVDSERSDTWRFAFEVPGLAALNTGGQAGVSSVACSSGGNCAIGGYYRIASGQFRWFVAAERKGVWANAITVPGLANLNSGAASRLLSLSCASAGNCAAGGSYRDRDGVSQGFVVSERNGVWSKAISVPGLGNLNKTGGADVVAISCPAPGNCAAGGVYGIRYSATGHATQGFVVSERNGKWGKAIEVPGLGALNQAELVAPTASVLSMSCTSTGNCVAVGYYTSGDIPDGPGVPTYTGFVASERNGTWGKAAQDPGLGALNAGQVAQTLSVSCPSAGNCAAGGYYLTAGQSYQGFVAGERHGVWGKATGVAGLGTLNADGTAEVTWVSCGSGGNCAAGGEYLDAESQNQGFVASEVNGIWGQAVEVPGPDTLNAGGNAAVNSVSCAPDGGCAAVGSYKDGSGHFQGFVVTS